jgi:hypothetical protein
MNRDNFRAAWTRVIWAKHPQWLERQAEGRPIYKCLLRKNCCLRFSVKTGTTDSSRTIQAFGIVVLEMTETPSQSDDPGYQ